MQVLIVQSCQELGQLWQRHLARLGMATKLVCCPDDAIACLSAEPVETIVLDLELKGGSAMNVADYASFRQPNARVVFVTGRTFFSDGSIFAHFANARAFLPVTTPPEDLATMVEHYCAEGC
ncbi:response regulator [Sulfitobacter mediterraneus]|jgi:DNA-binding NtrC family response regulator|uniref:response regulator n=1 Tax=Sulfitobacter mediterraneus TaxID=83219 RepID=UPI001934852A|nr:response regulator [Sulfitobacter mediterraneus]MBM1633403.1 response regulator [Sulfitobacter mediterraneus]MBM1640463.1 response regulator [Sulfitobacter mediterraneus]MBM1645268.1 response regulator [Sulfitobacter mediterraneus]MBM1648583.1 response regulator [Sulfitobacter mediterraneus]MBM1652603.1 response regulator [Sulfitobacter mediterraneus]